MRVVAEQVVKVMTQAERDLWWALIWQAAHESVPLAHGLAVAWGTGAELRQVDDGGYALSPIVGSDGWASEDEWLKFRTECLAPFREGLQRLLTRLTSAGQGKPAPGVRDSVLWQFQVSQELAGGKRPAGQNVFPDGKAAWDEYHRRVAAGDLYCPKPVPLLGQGDDRHVWAIPAGGASTLDLLVAAVQHDRTWAAYRAGPPAGLRYPVFVLAEGRWVEWDARWKADRRPKKGDWVARLPASPPRKGVVSGVS